jgi:hypothetical protein
LTPIASSVLKKKFEDITEVIRIYQSKDKQYNFILVIVLIVLLYIGHCIACPFYIGHCIACPSLTNIKKDKQYNDQYKEGQSIQ